MVVELPPIIYVLHGDDEMGIAQYLAGLKAKVGDSTLQEMNVSYFDGRTLAFSELVTASTAMPFLASRRLVIVTNPLANMLDEKAKTKWMSMLERVPATTALVLVETHRLTNEEQRRKGEAHWLENWAVEMKDRVFLKEFNLPGSGGMAEWIIKQAKLQGGQISRQAAELLSGLVGEDGRLADQEIKKLLTYVNYQQTIEVEDIEELTVFASEGDIFKMVDALGNGDGRSAVGMFHRLMADEDPLRMFGMVVRQFRLLLLTREIIDEGGGESDITRRMKIPPFVARKMIQQAGHFSLLVLEVIYRRLLEIDVDMKTGEMNIDLGIDRLIAELTV